ncbi:DUF2782 domain-containing protein [Methylophilus flavus]|jgi:hypothetical protein|uniref:DUF2782 domain-containing protein n=1 Tax=Methylophilus flavus TaxID=640084 RepID=A0ABW3P7P5_9PROT
MRDFPRFLLAVVCAAGFALPVWAAAPGNAELLEEVPSPPKIIEGQPIDQPTVTKRKDGENELEEYSINGDVYMVKVTPPSGKPYYLHREDRNGDWVNDGPTRPLSVPKWTLFRF